jgi:hypothetical protein
MTADLELYSRILYRDLRPWINTGFSENKFKQDLTEAEEVHVKTQPLYEVVFPKALSFKRKYYRMIIENEATRFLNELHSYITESINDKARAFHVDYALTRTLNQKLHDLAIELQKRACDADDFLPMEGGNTTPAAKADDSYILLYLKHQLVRLYMEVQENFAKLQSYPTLTEEEVYHKYFNEPGPVPSVIEQAEVMISEDMKGQYQEPRKTSRFKPVAADFRHEKDGILPYSEIVKIPDRFASFEQKLFENGYIDLNYNAIKKHGQKNEMAAIYLLLIDKGYFYDNCFLPKRKAIKPLDIRKFLDYRYQADHDKQFRELSNHTAEYNRIVSAHHWMENLLRC